MQLMLQNIQVPDDILKDEKYAHLFSVEAVNELVNTGVPFREAYRQIGEAIEKNNFHFSPQALQHTHEGSIGNLCTAEIKEEFQKVLSRFG